jgi:hypothetical protein
MPRGIIVTALCIFAAMLAVKDGRLPRVAGLTGSCLVAQRAADGSQLVACRAGTLEGRPDLSRRSCTAAGLSQTYQYWRCPAPLQAAAAP